MTHFSTWNWDRPGDKYQCIIGVLTINGVPLDTAVVHGDMNEGGHGTFTTGSDGVFEIAAPTDVTLEGTFSYTDLDGIEWTWTFADLVVSSDPGAPCADIGTLNAGVDPADFSGTLTWVTTLDGAIVCDVDVALTGTPYTLPCDSCEFAVWMEGTVTRDDSAPDCALDPLYTFVSDGSYTDNFLAYRENYEEYYAYLLTAGTVDPTIDGTLYTITLEQSLAYESGDETFGTFTRAGDDLTWGFDVSSTEYEYNETYGGSCDEVDILWSSSTTDNADDETGTGPVDCDGAGEVGELGDAWTFDVVAGDTIAVTVDTVATGTAFDPYFFLSSPDECLIAFADDNFDCTYAPVSW